MAVSAVFLASCGGGTPEQAAAAPAARRLASTAHVAADYNTTVQQLYLAYLGRPADPGGLQNWTTTLAALGIEPGIDSISRSYFTNPTVKAMVDGFATSQEAGELYTKAVTSVAFVNAIYQYVLGRGPDLDGLLFWARAIDDSGLSRQQAAISIMAGALANSSDQGKIDAKMVNNRVAVAGAFTSALVAKNKTTYYQGSAAVAQVRNFLGTVTDTLDPANAQSLGDCLVDSMGAIMTTTNSQPILVSVPVQPACSGGLSTIASTQ